MLDCFFHFSIMDFSSLPQDYFNTKRYFKESDKSLKEKGYVVDRYGRPIRKRKLKRTYSLSYVIYFSISLLGVVALLFFLVLILLDVISWGNSIHCVPGFTIGTCQRMDFLDNLIWSEKKEYNVNGDTCKYGVAFRTWAPKASTVLIQIHNSTGLVEYKLMYFLFLYFMY